MKTKIVTPSLIVAALFAALASTSAAAQHTAAPRIDQSQQHIRERIQHGIATGRLTPQEAHDLYQREREIRHLEIAMKRDGAVLPEERRQLRHELDGLSNLVERKLSNRHTVAPSALHAPGVERGKDYIRKRIEQGLDSGHITRWEAENLYEREHHLARHEVDAKSDGVLTQEERRQLRTEVAALSVEVERMIDNGARRRRALAAIRSA